MSSDRSLRLPIQVSRGCAQVSFQVEPSESVLRQFRSDLLEFVRSQDIDSVLVDLSGIRMLDAADLMWLRSTLHMTRLLGVHVVVTGLRAGVVVSIVELDIDFPFPAGQDIDHGFEIIRGLRDTDQDS